MASGPLVGLPPPHSLAGGPVITRMPTVQEKTPGIHHRILMKHKLEDKRMSTIEITTKITYPYLMGKRKSDLADWFLRELDEKDALRAEIDNLTKKLEEDVNSWRWERNKYEWLFNSALNQIAITQLVLTQIQNECPTDGRAYQIAQDFLNKIALLEQEKSKETSN